MKRDEKPQQWQSRTQVNNGSTVKESTIQKNIYNKSLITV